MWVYGHLALGLTVSGCGQNSTMISSSQDGLASMEIAPPLTLIPRGIDPGLLLPRVTINGEAIGPSPLTGSNIWQVTTDINEGDDVALRVDWIESFEGQELLLAVFENVYPNISRDTAVILFDDDYEIDDIVTYPEMDSDNDNVPNLVERREGSDPTSATDPGLFRGNAFVQGILPSRAPVIDGSFDGIWGEAQYRDRDSELLSIDNRMVGFDPSRPEGMTEYRWGALHDGQYLYLYVFGESAEGRVSHGDSEQPWHDDTIDIFWDGDRSQGATYDDVDDYHLLIPLLKLGLGVKNRSHLPEGPVDPDGRLGVGDNSVTLNNGAGVRFATCVCPGGDTYEIRLDMAELGIPLDRSFGFDVQLNDDVDGGTREYKFGWQAPSAAENQFALDETWEIPNRMGLLHLLPYEPAN